MRSLWLLTASYGGLLLLVSCGSASDRLWPGETTLGSHPPLLASDWRDSEVTEPPPHVEVPAPATEAPPIGSAPSEAPPVKVELRGTDESSFRNTYYDFPKDDGGPPEATIYTPTCSPIARVSQRFHDAVCVQGSGRLATGVTVSFAKRGCSCAAICPRTGQQICFEPLDPRRFPFGRGAMGRPIYPLRTVAVDSAVIPLGSVLFIPEYVGLNRPDGSVHDGCFVAEDRGVKVVGRQVDVFTGDPVVTASWNAVVPSNRGVHVLVGDRRCAPRP